MIREWWHKLLYSFRLRSTIDADLEQEIAFHIQERAEELERAGIARADALAQARREFGSAARIEEDSRAAWQFAWLERLVFDVRYSLRTLRRSPLFTTIAILSLALGIGANTAVFTLLDQLVLRLLPVKEPERLVMIWPTGPILGSSEGERVTSYPMLQEFQRKAVAFEYVFGRYDQLVALTTGGYTERVSSELVSGNYFQALGVEPLLGRVFSPESDDRVYRGHPSVVLSYRFWLNRFAGDPKVIGRKLLVNNYPMQVVGVTGPGFSGLDPAESPQLWIPIQMKPLMTPGDDDLGNDRAHWVHVFARLKPGYTIDSGRASLGPLFHQIIEQELREPALSRFSPFERDLFRKRTAMIETAASGYSGMRERYETALIVLFAMAGLILLIACANVASLLVARAVARQKEIAVRLAIGSGRRALVRQLLVESVLISLAGVAVGFALSLVTTRALLNMLPGGGANLMLHADPDARVLAFGFMVALVTGVLFGLAPALTSTRLDLITTLKDLASGRTSAGLRKTLVTIQVALAFLLLAGAGLFARTLLNLKTAPTGFQKIENLVTFEVDAAKLGYSVPRIHAFYEDALRDIRATAGVQSAGYALAPVLRGYHWRGPTSAEGYSAKEGEDTGSNRNLVSPGYWRTMGMPLLEGRDFDARDRINGRNPEMLPSVAIVNRTFAKHFFGNASPVGRHIANSVGQDVKLNIRIVGMVEDAEYEGPRSGISRQVFFPFAEVPVPLRAYFYVRTVGEPRAMFPVFRRIVAHLNPSMPVDDMKTLKEQLDETLTTERMIALLSLVFSMLATSLVALGLYGVVAFVVARRTKEIGLRMALGAPRRSVLWLVSREVLIVLGAGLGVGVPVAFLVSRYIASQLFGVEPADVATGAAAIAVLVCVGAAAAFVPARRASAIDPMTALHYE